MTSLLGQAHLMDLVLAITIFEGLLLAAYHHRTGRGLAPADYALNMLAGLCLMLALRAVLTDVASLWVLVFLMASGLAHGSDLTLRWRKKQRALEGPVDQGNRSGR